MTDLRKHTDRQLDAQRASAEATRETSDVNVVSLYYAVKVKIEEGRIDEARAMVATYRKAGK